MRFITESALREQYKTDMFTSFSVPNGSRLTPEAYQFLVDRKISIYYEDKQLDRLFNGHRFSKRNLSSESKKTHVKECQSSEQDGKTICKDTALCQPIKNVVLCETISLQLIQAEAKLFSAQKQCEDVGETTLIEPFTEIETLFRYVWNHILKGRTIPTATSLLEIDEESQKREEIFSIYEYSFSRHLTAAVDSLNQIRVAFIEIVKELKLSVVESYAVDIVYLEYCISKLEGLIVSLREDIDGL